MNVLIVYAHPEPQSLTGSLKDFAVKRLIDSGHQVQVSDLYAMNWKASLDQADNTDSHREQRFDPSLDSKKAFTNHTQTQDIALEQEKLLWADTLILQFPLWWFSMPAILKGWVDRVYAFGFAYGVGEHSDNHWGDRYGEGTLAGKRAMLMVSTGGWESHYSARGINGPMDDILFPIQHGILFYPGFSVLPPFVIHRTSRINEVEFARICTLLGTRLDNLETIEAIPFRSQNSGDYEIPSLTLRPEIVQEQTGFGVHISHGAAP